MNFDPGRLVQSVILISLSQGVHLDQVDELKTVILYLNYFVLNKKKTEGWSFVCTCVASQQMDIL